MIQQQQKHSLHSNGSKTTQTFTDTGLYASYDGNTSNRIEND